MELEFVNLKQCGRAPGEAVARLAAWHWRQGARVLILAADPQQAAGLDALLWTFDPASFVPHALAGGADQADEPILISQEPANLNHASVLIMTKPPASPQAVPPGFQRVIVLIPLEDGPDLRACRDCFRQARDQGLNPAHATSLPL